MHVGIGKGIAADIDCDVSIDWSMYTFLKNHILSYM